MELTFEERRVVGTLIEKGYTTPEQYPLTLNALVTGSNQKSCRSPVTQLDEEAVFLALDGLRQKGLSILIQIQSGRTDRWKHRFSEALELDDKETAILGELLLRGPQTDGELRQHASRMVKMESLDEVGGILSKLMGRDPPLAVRLSPEGRKRGVRYAHCFYRPEELEELRQEEESAVERKPEARREPKVPPEVLTKLQEDQEILRTELTALADRIRKLEESLGGPA